MPAPRLSLRWLVIALALACAHIAHGEARAEEAGAAYADDIRAPGAAAPAAARDATAAEEEPSPGAALWRRIREGEAGRVLFLDAGSAVLIQADSETWRRIVADTVQSLGAWLLLLTIIVLATLYAARGRTTVSRRGQSQRRIQRFTRVQRIAHWMAALSFLVLAATGLNLVYGREVLLPALGADAFATVAGIGQVLHHVAGFVFGLGILLLALVWFPGSWTDREVRRELRGAGQPATGKYSSLQKASWAFFVGIGVLLTATGGALLFPAVQDAAGLAGFADLRRVQVAHSALGFLSIAAVVAHVYLDAIDRRGSLSGVVTGYVSEAWARQHHPGWLATLLRRAQAGAAAALPGVARPVATQPAAPDGAKPAAEDPPSGAAEAGDGGSGRRL